MKPIPTIYEWAGGKEKLEQLTEVFYSKVLNDELLEPVFRNLSEEHPRHVAHFIAEVFGGPALYTGQDNSNHSTMVAHHLGKMLDETKRQRWMALFLQSVDEVKLPDDPEFRSSLIGYLEWGTRIAVINSHNNENPIDNTAPMPRWGWGETGGPYMGEN